MIFTDEMMERASEKLGELTMPRRDLDDDLTLPDVARAVLEATFEGVSPTSLTYLAPFIQKSELVFIMQKGGTAGGTLWRPVDEETVERLGGWRIDITWADQGKGHINSFKVSKIPGRGQSQQDEEDSEVEDAPAD